MAPAMVAYLMAFGHHPSHQFRRFCYFFANHKKRCPCPVCDQYIQNFSGVPVWPAIKGKGDTLQLSAIGRWHNRFNHRPGTALQNKSAQYKPDTRFTHHSISIGRNLHKNQTNTRKAYDECVLKVRDMASFQPAYLVSRQSAPCSGSKRLSSAQFWAKPAISG